MYNKILEMYKNGLPLSYIRKEFGVGYHKLMRIILKMGEKKRGVRKYTHDKDYWNKIDNEEKAYWLGFIYAEGNIYKRSLRINLSNVDADRLFLLKEHMKYTGPIKNILRTSSSLLQINSKNLVEQMEKLGVVPNKSDKLIFPNISEDLKRHFIRGFLDGDGWITVSHESRNVGMCSASKKLIYEIMDHINSHFDLNIGSLVERKPTSEKHKKLYQLSYGSNIGEMVCSYLYDSAHIYIERKYNKYQETVAKNKKMKKVKSSRFFGVCLKNGKWKSYVQYEGKKNDLGIYKTEEEAAIVYNQFLISKNLVGLNGKNYIYRLNNI